jgi:predicted transcriptional regulator
MSMMSLRLPDSLHRKVRELAAKESISINQFIATAVAEKMSALLTEDYLEERAKRANPAAFDRILARVPDVPPMPGDEQEPRLNGRPRSKRSKSAKVRKRHH